MTIEFENVEVETPYELDIPDGYRVVRKTNGTVEVVRPDGFTVFLQDEDSEIMNWLNSIRLFSPRMTVIQVVGLYRGMQISHDYAKRYAPDLISQIASNPIEQIKLKMIQNYKSIIE